MDVFRTSEGHIAVMALRLSKPLEELPENILDEVKLIITRSSTVVSSKHAAIAAYRALRAFREGKNITRNLESEIAVCLTGERQIHKALAQVNPVGSEKVVSILVSAQQMEWDKLSAKICETLRAVQINEFGSIQDIIKDFGLENFSSCSERKELIILEKSALVELER